MGGRYSPAFWEGGREPCCFALEIQLGAGRSFHLFSEMHASRWKECAFLSEEDGVRNSKGTVIVIDGVPEKLEIRGPSELLFEPKFGSFFKPKT